MQAALKLKTTVLPGNRVEFTAPELPEGAEVEVFVALPETSGAIKQPLTAFTSALDYLDSLPPLQHTAEEWAEIERGFQEERNSWDR